MTDLEIFINVPDDLTDTERAAYFDEACGGDEKLRAGVEALVAAHQESPTFMESTLVRGSSDAEAISETDLEQPGSIIDRYKILQKIGEGGFGTVWMAEQSEPISRMVALKVVKAGMDTKQVLARFEVERQALAMMDHPNIAKVLDAGATGAGRPYFVMDLVKGIPITRFCCEQKFDPKRRIELFLDVCSAINHAHQKGIIHRDIKPSNVMVTLIADKPVVKVIDFGIAKATQGKLTDQTLFTRFEQFIGTPVYMAPEQAAMSGVDIDTRSDIYSLGVLLYELLAGKTPFDSKTLVSAGYDEMRRIICEDEPPRPSTRLTELRGAPASGSMTRMPYSAIPTELDWIVMKAIEKDRGRRYETANSFALDIGRFLADEPVTAVAPSAAYRMGKFAHRNRTALVVSAAMILLLLGGTAVSMWQAAVATQARNEAQGSQEKAVAAEGRVQVALDLAGTDRDRAIQSARELSKQNYASDMGLAHRAIEDGDLGRAQYLLGKHRPSPSQEDFRGIEWRHLWSRSQGNFDADLGPYLGFLSGLTISPDGQFVALNRSDPTRLEIIHLASGSIAKSIMTPEFVIPLAYSPSGRVLVGNTQGQLIAWDTRTWKERRACPLTAPFTFGSRGDQEIIVAFEGEHLSMWDVATWQKIGDLENKEPGAPLLVPSVGLPYHMTNCLSGSPEQDVVYLAGANKIRRWELNERTELPPLEVPGMACLASSYDGQLAGADGIGNVHLIEPQSGVVLHTFKSHKSWTTCLEFTRDGTRLVSASNDRQLIIYDPVNKAVVGRLLGHRGEVTALDISADGRTVISGSSGSRVLSWSLTGSEDESFDVGVIKTSSVLEDGRILLLREDAEDLEYYDPVSGSVEPVQAERFVRAMRERQDDPIAFSPTAKWALSIDGSKLAVWNVFTGELEGILEHPSGSIGGAFFSPDGKFLITGSGDSEVRLWQTQDWTSMPLSGAVATHLHWGTFACDKRRVAIACSDWSIRVFDFEQEPREIALPGGVSGLSVALSNNGRWLAAGGERGIHILDLESMKMTILQGHSQSAVSLRFAPDDRTLISTTGSKVMFWQVETWQELMTYRDNTPPRVGFMPRLKISPDGRYLIREGTLSGESGPRIRVWQTPPFEEIDSIKD